MMNLMKGNYALGSIFRRYSVGGNPKQLVTALEKTELEALISAKTSVPRKRATYLAWQSLHTPVIQRPKSLQTCCTEFCLSASSVLAAICRYHRKSQSGMLGLKRGVGTKEQPNLIPSAYNSRIIGCICEEDTSHINWMWLHRGAPTKCPCGYWFKLVEKSTENT